jgi:hypothetical protein
MDIVKYRKLAFTYNGEAARRIVHTLRMSTKSELSPVRSDTYAGVVT